MAETANRFPVNSRVGANQSDAHSAPRRHAPGNRYSSFVIFMKLALPIVAVGLVLLIVVWPQFWDSDSRFTLPSIRITADDLNSRQMINPQYQGFDKENRPFSVTADLATQKPDNDEVVDLDNPKAELMLENGKWVTIDAQSGVYNQSRQTMDLKGRVNLNHEDDFVMTTEEVSVGIKAGTAFSNSPVEGHGPDGNLTGEGFRLLDEGARIFLLGKSRVILYDTGESEKK
ncbi:LPS export ABC transporter periplasmic protein LptC [Limibacillus sp. MBR-115]|uniref:LPS export ABC transporter periplasmic protein LptC n=1 Tax=Limibacillus sp. MBR-115 TaxID=3156465 RepID=UPI003393F3B4